MYSNPTDTNLGSPSPGRKRKIQKGITEENLPEINKSTNRGGAIGREKGSRE
jgi:hypothetical protein